MSAVPALRAALAEIDPDLPLYSVDTLRGAIELDTWFFPVFGGVFMTFGLVALILAAVGLYGVMAFSVTRRTRELGIRMALGARPAQVRAMILRQGLVQVALGIAAGLLLAASLARLLAVILFDVEPADPIVFGGVSVVLVATALLACLVPARRATAVDPMIALRSE